MDRTQRASPPPLPASSSFRCDCLSGRREDGGRELTVCSASCPNSISRTSAKSTVSGTIKFRDFVHPPLAFPSLFLLSPLFSPWMRFSLRLFSSSFASTSFLLLPPLFPPLLPSLPIHFQLSLLLSYSPLRFPHSFPFSPYFLPFLVHYWRFSSSPHVTPFPPQPLLSLGSDVRPFEITKLKLTARVPRKRND